VHKGYSTPEHLAALQLHGACAVHRRSFAPVRLALERMGIVVTSPAAALQIDALAPASRDDEEWA